MESTTVPDEAMADSTVSNGCGNLHKVYAKPHTPQHNHASDVDVKVKPSRGATFGMITSDEISRLSRGRHFSKSSAGSHTCSGCGGTRHNTREKQCPRGRKCYKCGRGNHFASVCHAANKMHFAKRVSNSAYVNEPTAA